MPGAPQFCEEKKRLRAAYTDALAKLREAAAVLQRAQYGPGFLDARRKPNKLAPSMTRLGGRWKNIARHTAVSSFCPYASA
jgi:hypothetical protein